jgi:hypothetical protein
VRESLDQPAEFRALESGFGETADEVLVEDDPLLDQEFARSFEFAGWHRERV